MKASIAISYTRQDGVTLTRSVDMSTSPYTRETAKAFKARVKRLANLTVAQVLR